MKRCKLENSRRAYFGPQIEYDCRVSKLFHPPPLGTVIHLAVYLVWIGLCEASVTFNNQCGSNISLRINSVSSHTCPVLQLLRSVKIGLKMLQISWQDPRRRKRC
jgi:hypothetical protein